MAKNETQRRAGRSYAGGNSGKAQIRAVRHDGWTEERREIFLETLAETCNVTAAFTAAGMTSSSAWALRKRDAGFAQAWDEAIAIAYEQLELVMLERAINGTEKPIVRGGKEVATMKQYSDGVGIRLLQAHRETAMRVREREGGRFDPIEAFEEVKRRLAVIHERKKANEGSGDMVGGTDG
ncbi:hypothetical protein [Parasphingopyxis lamellibrachiae]|uniref:Terminase small subunit n=1 Tax=Parasphingopyxis lamellibrachiae TaxID=680125 RepID=A0A3D9FE78_9SPHN|nr:hypothetical protein [Parasphingopyxis lamellibrachiae]RED16053.1 hypothetical protein DFR46_1064 [Parasphingopyxis lamellibrachiae]